jgi:hypothetical protein
MDFSKKIDRIMNENFRGYSASNNTQSYSYNSSSNNNIYYNSSSGYNTPNTINGITVYYPNNISLSFSQNHCKVSG